MRFEHGRVRGLPDLIANLFFFMPLGVAWVWARRPRDAIRAAAGALAVGGLLSAAVEATQLLTVTRTTSLGDLVLNAGGCALAAASAQRARQRFGLRAMAWLAPRLRHRPETVVGAIATVAVLAEGFAPYDLTFDVGEIMVTLRAFAAEPLGLRNLGDVIERAIPFGAIGLLMTRQVRLDEQTARLGIAISVVTLIGGSIEVGQIFVASRVPGLGDAVAASLGGALGAVGCIVYENRVARREPNFAPRVPRPPGDCVRTLGRMAPLLFYMYAASVGLQPFELADTDAIAARLRPLSLVPFWSYYENLGLHVAGDLVAAVVAYSAFGYLLAAQESGAPSAGRRAAIHGAALALAIEGAQVFLAGRSVEMTDAAVAAAAAWGGARLYAELAANARTSLAAGRFRARMEG